MPLCECGTTLTDLRSAHELARWASREGDCWDYRENGTAYWKYCRPCHMRRWPNDRRYNNRWSSPAPPWYNIQVSGVCRLLARDLHLAREPPELRREESKTVGLRQVRRRVAASPSAVGSDGPQAPLCLDSRYFYHEEQRLRVHYADDHGYPLADTTDYEAEAWTRCAFANERAPGVCAARGCSRVVAGFYRVQRADLRLDQLHVTFLWGRGRLGQRAYWGRVVCWDFRCFNLRWCPGAPVFRAPESRSGWLWRAGCFGGRVWLAGRLAGWPAQQLHNNYTTTT